MLISSKEEAMNGGYHYLGCAKTMAQIGNAFADSLLEMEKIESAPIPCGKRLLVRS